MLWSRMCPDLESNNPPDLGPDDDDEVAVDWDENAQWPEENDGDDEDDDED